LDGKSIKKEKDTVKEKNRAEGQGAKSVFWRKREFAGIDFTNRRG
jgi:hypothetical protein